MQIKTADLCNLPYDPLSPKIGYRGKGLASHTKTYIYIF